MVFLCRLECRLERVISVSFLLLPHNATTQGRNPNSCGFNVVCNLFERKTTVTKIQPETDFYRAALNADAV